MIGRRDRALLCMGFAGAFRRSELCALDVADLTEVPDGLRILIRRSKGDQEGQGQEVAIPRGWRQPRSAPARCSEQSHSAARSRTHRSPTTARHAS
jgi:integrase